MLVDLGVEEVFRQFEGQREDASIGLGRAGVRGQHDRVELRRDAQALEDRRQAPVEVRQIHLIDDQPAAGLGGLEEEPGLKQETLRGRLESSDSIEGCLVR